jgi:hypothetical protein
VSRTFKTVLKAVAFWLFFVEVLVMLPDYLFCAFHLDTDTLIFTHAPRLILVLLVITLISAFAAFATRYAPAWLAATCGVLALIALAYWLLMPFAIHVWLSPAAWAVFLGLLTVFVYVCLRFTKPLARWRH